MFDKNKIKEVPDSPGVYLMKDRSGGIIYAGKALSLRKRVSSYFTGAQSAKTRAMLLSVEDIETRSTRTEAEALLLEISLIKKYQPRYNISFKDDKSYPFIKVTKEDFPALFVCRRRKKDNALYLGPFTSAKLLKQALKIARVVFPFRSCHNMPKQECLYSRIGLCPAPCSGKVSRKEYAGILKNLKMFLNGNYEDVLRQLSLKMRRLSKQQEFEEAAKVRDQINALGAVDPGGGLLSRRRREIALLGSFLGLKSPPLRIEAFDISNLSKYFTVGSMVRFLDGLPDKDNYRRFRIKQVTGVDDYAMIREIVRRRYARLVREKKELPDLVVIDGGRGHLNAAQSVIKDLGLNIPLTSIAKGKEQVFVQSRQGPLDLSLDSEAMHLIQRIRNEAHRFALKYHKLLRKGRMFRR